MTAQVMQLSGYAQGTQIVVTAKPTGGDQSSGFSILQFCLMLPNENDLLFEWGTITTSSAFSPLVFTNPNDFGPNLWGEFPGYTTYYFTTNPGSTTSQQVYVDETEYIIATIDLNDPSIPGLTPGSTSLVPDASTLGFELVADQTDFNPGFASMANGVGVETVDPNFLNDPVFYGQPGGTPPSYDGTTQRFPIEAPVQVPVELISFTAERYRSNSTYLNWVTVTEEAADYFEIQRSFDKQTWITVGYVEAVGNSTDIERYEYFDMEVYDGIQRRAEYLYRLNIVDIDGDAALSNIEAVKFQKEIDVATVFTYPNPSTRGLTLELNLTEDTQLGSTIEMYNQLGQMVYSREIPEGSDMEYIDYGTHNINTGAYVLRVIDASNAIIDQEKIIVQRN